MQIRISTRHGSLSEASQQKITDKLEKLNRLFERLTSIEVTVDLANESKPSVEVLVSAEHKHDFVAEHSSDELMGSVDKVLRKLEQQIRKYKEKLHDRHRVEPGSRITPAEDIEG